MEIKIYRVKTEKGEKKENKIKKERGTNKQTDKLNLADVIGLLILRTCSHGLNGTYIKHTRRNILSLMRNYMIKDEFALNIEMLTLETTKLKWIWTKLYTKRINLINQMFNLIDEGRNCF